MLGEVGGNDSREGDSSAMLGEVGGNVSADMVSLLYSDWLLDAEALPPLNALSVWEATVCCWCCISSPQENAVWPWGKAHSL